MAKNSKEPKIPPPPEPPPVKMVKGEKLGPSRKVYGNNGPEVRNKLVKASDKKENRK